MNRRLILAVLIGIFLVFNVWAMYTFITSKFPGANDFFLRWQGTRSYLFDGLNPYSRAATDRVEIGLYGHVAEPDQYPGDFVYPFYIVFLVAPFALLSYPVAAAVWLVLMGASIVYGFWLLADLFKWRPPAWLLIAGMIWSLVFYPAARGMFLGQPGVLVAFLEILTIWALAKNHDALAGVALAVSTIKPPMGYFIVPFLLLWGLSLRRWRFVGSFVVVFAVLAGVSFVLLPSWFTDWLTQVARYPSYTGVESPVWIVTLLVFPFLGQIGGIVISGALILLMLWAWYRAILRRDTAMVDWTVALTLAVTHLVSPRTATPHFIVFGFVLVFYFAHLTRADRRRGPLWVLLIMVALTVMEWVIFLTTLQGRAEQPINFLPLPFGILILLLITRRQWLEARPAMVKDTEAGLTSPPDPLSASSEGESKAFS